MHLGVVAIEKGAFWSLSTKVVNFIVISKIYEVFRIISRILDKECKLEKEFESVKIKHVLD